MKTPLPKAAADVEELLSCVPPAVLLDFTHRLAAFLDDLGQFEPTPPPGAHDALRSVLDTAGALSHGPTATAGEKRADPDHDYSDWHRLTRSLWFNWADDPEAAGAALPPRVWCAMQVFARSGPHEPIKVAEVGAGVGRLAHDVMSMRPRGQFWVGDVSLESLVLAALLHGGAALTLPRRVSFARSPSGIDWFTCRAPGSASPVREKERAPAPLVVYRQDSLPRDHDYDFVIACNTVSLFAEPLGTIERLAGLLRPGGHLVLTDLYSWRVETPRPRRIAGPDQVAAVLQRAGCSIRAREVIPYAENWGHERTYCWTSHGLVAGRDR
ncbi:class I SAM-dependent methyltransferase [Streptomyces sp. NPDC005526]|uniref:class I SAM-dependent methyltransferase n=1 Tax=Streptomyces sp. NPDC005526 TaxID=3156885 RepID=UPI0033A945C4